MITGCSKGIGKSLTEELLRRNQHVVATARRLNSIEDLKKGNKNHLLTAKLDVTRKSEIIQLMKRALKRFGKIDVLVNNAGYGYYGTQEEADIDAVQEMFKTNVFGLARVTQAVLPMMRENGSGVIVNISSVGGRVAFPFLGFYHASKFAVEGLSEALYYEICDFGIRVIIIEPGGHNTNFSQSGIRSPYLSDLESPYASLRKKWEGISKKIVPEKGEPINVSNAIIEAVEREVPFQRVQVGDDAKLLVRLRVNSGNDQNLVKQLHKLYGLGKNW